MDLVEFVARLNQHCVERYNFGVHVDDHVVNEALVTTFEKVTEFEHKLSKEGLNHLGLHLGRLQLEEIELLDN